MSEKIKLPAVGFRAGEISKLATPTDADADDRRADLVFSTEAEVQRSAKGRDGSDFHYMEVLGHDPSEVNLETLASGRAPLLVDHERTIDSQVGVVERAWIDAGKGRATVRFGRSARASEILERVRDGEITGVSVGYKIHKFTHTGGAPARPVLRAHWAPFEITLTPTPADAAAGFNRADDAQFTIELEIETKKIKEKEMPDKIEQKTTQTRAPAPTAPSGQSVDPIIAERARIGAITTRGAQYKMTQVEIDAAIAGGTTADDFNKKILDKMGSDTETATRSADSAIGLSEKEVSNYSLMAAVRYLHNPSDENARAAAFEIEASRAAEAEKGEASQGIMIPSDVLSNKVFGRTQQTAVAADGGALVPTDYLTGSFIDLLRKRAALPQLGVRVLSGLTGNVSIPKQTGGATTYWFGEGAGPQASTSQFGNVTLTPHSLGAKVSITRRMVLQSSPDIEALVRDDMIRAISTEIDRVGINGDASSDAPDGLLNTPDLSAVTFSTAGQPTWAEIVNLETAVAAADADDGNLQYLFNATVNGHLKTVPKVPNTASFISENGRVNGYNSIVSNNAPAGGALFGNWSDLLIGLWSGIDLRVDKSTDADSDGLVLRAFVDLDFAVRHGQSFAYGSSI